MENNQPIIIKRVKRFAAGHHGGAWKIAFADFATAMMAFFLVLWLMSTATPEQKIAIAGYFKDPIGFSESGTPFVLFSSASRRNQYLVSLLHPKRAEKRMGFEWTAQTSQRPTQANRGGQA